MLRKRIRSVRASWVLAGLGIVSTAAYLAPGRPGERSALFTGALALSLLGAFLARRRSRVVERPAWLASGLAFCLFLLGLILWLWAPGSQFGPFEPASDALFLAATLTLAVATAAVAFARGAHREGAAWVEAAILTVVVGLTGLELFPGVRAANPSLGVGGRLASGAQPVAELLVVAIVLALVLSRNGRDRSALLFAGGAALLVVSDLAFRAGGNDSDGFRPGGASGALWIVGFVLIGVAALRPSTACAIRPSRRREVLGRIQLALVAAAVFVPPILLVRDLRGRTLLGANSLTAAAIGAIVVLALAAVRLRHLFSTVRRAEAHRGEARLSALILHSADAIVLADREHRITFASPSAESLSGKRRSALLGGSVLDWFTEDQRDAVGKQLANLAALPPGSTVPLEGSVHGADDHVRMVEGFGQNLLEDANVGAIVVTLRDTTTRRELEQQLERRAFHDELTGLANRALFADRMSHALKRKQRDHQVGMAVLFIDLDDFKAVNDGMGHDAGDDLIRCVAERIRSSVRPGDTVARLGGDEFAVLVEDTLATDDVMRLAERLIEMLALPIEVKGVGMAVPASIGVTYATRESTVDSLLRDADIAMYRAKSLGKSRIEVFDTTLRDDAVRRLALRVELPAALRQGQFRVVYQPIRHVVDEVLAGFEALVRWQHPQHGLISPAEFIPAAEETGIIVDLGRWVLAEACRNTAEWNRRWHHPISISVNVSGLQLHQPGFVDDVRGILDSTKLAPGCLTLELTESILVQHQRVTAILLELRELGIGIAIDDFGTGYSSLSYLQEFPATSIKVDRAFVSRLDDGGDTGIVRSILAIGETLGLTTVAEGVETTEQMEVLRDLGCDRAQGFLFGRPQSAGDIEGMLEMIRLSRTAERARAETVYTVA
ncbi:MAG TPA: EAL domain-containing protein [Gaiellaceae bacterium]|jgi:diguanylate cyclase (GGDEF)-like protein/PAS domain S-box-containing protein|nr:EAL domain-containing protein [Gaiellaceae bacterium]